MFFSSGLDRLLPRCLWNAALLLLTCLPRVLVAQEFTLEPTDSLIESIREKRPLGAADFRFGVMAMEGPDSRAGDYAFVFIPPGVSGRLCVELNSVDDVYQGSAAYTVPRVHPERVRLHLGSRRLHILRRYTSYRLAILSWFGNDCSTLSGTFVPSSWTASANPRNLLILVASGAMRTVVAGISPLVPEVPCERLGEPSGSNYDFRCPVQIQNSGPPIRQFEIRRRNGTRRLDDIDVSIQFR